MSLEEILNTIKKEGFTAYQIAKETDLTEAGIGRILSGKTKNPQKSTVEILKKFVERYSTKRIAGIEKSSQAKEESLRFEDIVAKRVLENLAPQIQKTNEKLEELIQNLNYHESDIVEIKQMIKNFQRDLLKK